MQWILISLLLLLQLPSWAEPSYDKLRDLMIEANTDTVIELIEKDFRKRNGKLKPIKIPEESASLYAIALIVN